MTHIETGIVKALVYADLFDFPLTKKEICARYIGNKTVKQEMVGQILADLVDRRRIDSDGTYYFLPGKNQLAGLRKNRLLPSTQKQMRATAIALQLARIPGVLGVALTGTVAVENAHAEDDIDLMIVTQPGRLWLTRLLVTGYLDLLGLRRKPGQEEVNNAFCVNLYVDAQGLEVPKQLQNLYTAHEVIQATFVWQQMELATYFLQENRWIKRFLPNVFIPQNRTLKRMSGKMSLVESLSYALQRWYMNRRKTREWVTQSQAYFHPKDMAKIVLSRYDQSLKDYELA